jgi:prevent-host-death family protein
MASPRPLPRLVELKSLLDKRTNDLQDGSSYLRSYPLHEIGIKELKNTTSRVLEEVEGGERVIVTKRGRPAAVIMSMEDAEDFVLAHAEEFAEMRLKGRREHAAGETLDLDDVT